MNDIIFDCQYVFSYDIQLKYLQLCKSYATNRNRKLKNHYCWHQTTLNLHYDEKPQEHEINDVL